MAVPFTEDQEQQLIILEVGDTADGVISQSVPLYWLKYAAMAQVAPRLQGLYTKRDAYLLKIGRIQELAIDTSIEQESIKWSQQVEKSLLPALSKVQAEIEKVEENAAANRAPAVGQLTTTAPITPGSDPRTVFSPDPNAREYRGDPLLSPFYRRSW